jgi:hypothetical protein
MVFLAQIINTPYLWSHHYSYIFISHFPGIKSSGLMKKTNHLRPIYFKLEHTLEAFDAGLDTVMMHINVSMSW